jgi:hypothetical protein
MIQAVLGVFFYKNNPADSCIGIGPEYRNVTSLSTDKYSRTSSSQTS